MDVFSYLLGKNAGGGSSGGGLDWTQIGYEETPQEIINAFNYSKQIYDNWDSSTTSMANMFQNNKDLIFVPNLDTSNVKNFNSTFSLCTNIMHLPEINMESATSMQDTFKSCTLKKINIKNTNKVENFSGAFRYNYNLTDLSLINMSSSQNQSNMFDEDDKIINLGGFEDLGKAYLTTRAANYSSYSLNIRANTGLTHDSLMNVINKLYDIATKGCNTQILNIGNNVSKLTAEEIAIATNKGWTVT